MKNRIFKIFIALLFVVNCTDANARTGELPLIPMPNRVDYKEGGAFLIKEDLAIGYVQENLKPIAIALQKIIKKNIGLDLPVALTDNAEITLSLDSSLIGPEKYILESCTGGIAISGTDEEAVFRGVTTLGQIIAINAETGKPGEVEAIKIEDAPRFGYRALMLDPARNFLPVEDVKFFIDQMAKYKFNVLQLHLSDDQGWRIELENYPGLSSDKAYTKEDIKSIIEYAAERYIDVVPEIDIPGHTSAFLKVYPELGCDNHRGEEIIIGKTDNRMLCASNQEVYNIFEGIIDEICELFSSDYIHLGGDEAAIPKNWAECSSCREMMSQLGYTEPSQLMIPFFDKMLGFVRKNGKKPILWCELNNIYPPADDFLFPYPDDVTLVTWRARLTPTCLELTAEKGYPLIMAPGEYAYLDYPQMKGDLPEFNNWGMPVTTLERTYEFDPGYGLPIDDQAHIMGIMGTLWGEAIKDINRVNYMAFPRALALSEAGWTQMESRDWESFKSRLYPNLLQLMKAGVSFRVPFEIVTR